MPIIFKFDETLDVLFTRAEGLISYNDIKIHIDSEASANGLGYRELFDASGAYTDMSAAEINSLAMDFRSRMTRTSFGPTAVVTQNDVFFGMARMLEIISDVHRGPLFAVFRDRENALQWLLTTAGAGTATA